MKVTLKQMFHILQEISEDKNFFIQVFYRESLRSGHWRREWYPPYGAELNSKSNIEDFIEFEFPLDFIFAVSYVENYSKFFGMIKKKKKIASCNIFYDSNKNIVEILQPTDRDSVFTVSFIHDILIPKTNISFPGNELQFYLYKGNSTEYTKQNKQKDEFYEGLLTLRS